jgi:hypothetical protein
MANKQAKQQSKTFLCFLIKHFRSRGEENERQMANNVNARDESL